MDYTASYARQHPETVVAAARRRSDVRIVADNGNAYGVLSDPKFINGEWMFTVDGWATGPGAIAAYEENAAIAAAVGGKNTVGEITGSGAHWDVESVAAEVRRYSLW